MNAGGGRVGEVEVFWYANGISGFGARIVDVGVDVSSWEIRPDGVGPIGFGTTVNGAPVYLTTQGFEDFDGYCYARTCPVTRRSGSP